MSKEAQEFRSKIEQMIKESAETTFSGEVVSVDEAEKSCVVQVGNINIEDVRLNSIIQADLKSFSIVPAPKSKVLLTRIGLSNEMCIVQYSEIDKVLIEIGEQSFEMNKDGFLFNKGENKGLIIIDELTKNLEKLTARVDTIYDGLSKLSPDPPQAGSASVTSGLKAIVSPAKEDFSNIENEKVKH